MARKLYPIGIQTFERIREEDKFYVDKTEYVYRMTHTDGTFFFLSRPRRFGKSLLVSTFRSYFEGRKDLFEGLAIERLEKEWMEYPVLHFSMAGGKHMEKEQLNRYLDYILKDNEQNFDVVCDSPDPNVRLSNLIKTVYQKTGKKVVVLIDEYDAPLLDVAHEEESLDVLRNVMRNFYSPLKDCEPMLRFVFLTGITKFSQLSIFSELNNIKNISMDEPYAGICGITKEEMLTQMSSDIDELASKLQLTREETIQQLKGHYDGYHFSWPSPDVFNPFSLLNCFADGKLNAYWFGLGTPTYLINMMRKYEFLPTDLGESTDTAKEDFDAATETMTTIIPLLYQSGYFTIKGYDEESDLYTLGLPNKEIKVGLFRSLVPHFLKEKSANGNTTIAKMSVLVKKGDMDAAFSMLNDFLATVPYCDNTNYEGHWQQTLYIMFALLTNYRILVEQHTAKGRTDITLETNTTIYVMELFRSLCIKFLPCLFFVCVKKLSFDYPYTSSNKPNSKPMAYTKTACALLQTLLALPLSAEAQTYYPSHENRADSLQLPALKHETLVQPHIDKGVLKNALDALNGQSAGVNVTSNGLDRMAMLNSVRVRGTTSIMGGNDPLVIIDGVASDITTLSTIYPADIESFNILKNASETAVYGARGASGVIEVRTKKGTGNGFQISYEGNVGVEKMYRHLNMLSAAGYRTTASSLGVFCNDGGCDTDFYQAITRTGFVQNHYLAFSGGNEISNYRASLGYVDHNTIIRTKDYSNLVVKADLTQKAFDNRLTADFGVFGSSFKNHDIFDTQMLFYSAACQNPTFPEGRDANGNWTKNQAASFINPPVVLLTEKNDSKELNFDAHLRLVYAVTPDLNVTAFGSFSYTSTEKSQFCPTYVWAQGNVYRGETKQEEGLGNVSADYAHTWGQHRLELHASTEYQKRVTTAFWSQAKGIPTNLFNYDNIGATASRPYGATGSTYEERSLASVMGNASYTLRSRYTFNASLRADGSSMVSDDQTWGLFPSLSASWNVKNEFFMKNVRPVSMLKLRAGWGQSGNLGGISAYTTRNTAVQTGVVPVDNAPTVTLGRVRNTNSYLKWETKTTWNVGLDLGLWQNRVVLSAEYYHSLTTDMLYDYDVPVPPFAFDKLLANIGSMSNSGWELGLLFTPVQRKDMELNVNLNLSFQKNKLRSLSGNYQGYSMSAAPVTAIGSLTGAGQNGGDNNVVYQIVGQPLGVFYLPHCRGLVLDESGHYKYDIEDLNGDGVIDLSDGGDRYIAGQATPKVTLGSNISFRYRQFYVSLQMNGAFGHKIFNGTGLAFTNMSSFPDYNVLADAPAKNIVDQRVSDYWLESGNYLNFENLTLGYDVPLRSHTVRSLRFSCSVSNLGTISSYSGLTPIINSYVVNSTLGIDDKRTYPLYRTYSVGLSVQF